MDALVIPGAVLLFICTWSTYKFIIREWRGYLAEKRSRR